MQYWKRVSISNFEQLQARLLKYVRREVNFESRKFWTELPKLSSEMPELVEAIEQTTGLKPWLFTALTLFEPQTTLHTDHTAGQRGQLARLNLPLLNCEKSQTVFYDVGSAEPIAATGPGTKVWAWDRAKPITRVVLSEPTILRVSEVHAVHNFSRDVRIAITVNLEPDAASLLA